MRLLPALLLLVLTSACSKEEPCTPIEGNVSSPGYDACDENLPRSVCCSGTPFQVDTLEACILLLADGSFDACDLQACQDQDPCSPTTAACSALLSQIEGRLCPEAPCRDNTDCAPEAFCCGKDHPGCKPGECRTGCSGDPDCEVPLVCDLASATCYDANLTCPPNSGQGALCVCEPGFTDCSGPDAPLITCCSDDATTM